MAIALDSASHAAADDTTPQPAARSRTVESRVAQLLRAAGRWAVRTFDHVNGARPVSDIPYADFAMVGRAGEA